ncbi:MAG: septal ring lytic transglycosylase RlpA family protein [Treponema sp.]|nr:septal ring lytic transglycosylase RlpA family protein [Candidatus Treponema equifaecale]
MKKLLFVFFLFVSAFSFADFYKTNVTASYYAEDFHGKKTSNGEIFNMYSLTCAHKMLPFNTVVRVTNIKNGKTVDVRVNDRGPFVGTREMDLSKAAAVKLDMIKSGTAKVNIQIISLGQNTKASIQTAQKACQIAKVSYNTNFSNSIKTSSGTASSATVPAVAKNSSPVKTVPSSVPKTASDDPNQLWDIQIGSFSSRANANNLAQKLLKEGFTDVVFQSTETVVRVVIRKVENSRLESVQNKLSENGYSGFVVKKRV